MAGACTFLLSLLLSILATETMADTSTIKLRVILVRHGESEANERGFIAGQSDWVRSHEYRSLSCSATCCLTYLLAPEQERSTTSESTGSYWMAATTSWPSLLASLFVRSRACFSDGPTGAGIGRASSTRGDSTGRSTKRKGFWSTRRIHTRHGL